MSQLMWRFVKYGNRIPICNHIQSSRVYSVNRTFATQLNNVKSQFDAIAKEHNVTQMSDWYKLLDQKVITNPTFH